MVFLSRNQIIELTGYTLKPKQIYALRLMGIHFRVRPDGSPVVHESEFIVKNKTESSQPNLGGLNA